MCCDCARVINCAVIVLVLLIVLVFSQGEDCGQLVFV